MTRFHRTLTVSLGALCSLAAQFSQLNASTTFFVGDGGSISAAIAAASSGDIIEIQSNQFFNETLSWSNKFLTVRAGNGFSPGISQITNVVGTSSTTGGNFIRLAIDRLALNATGTTFSNVTFQQDSFNTKVNLGGTGSYNLTALFENDQFNTGLIASDTGEARYSITLRASTSLGDVNFVGNTGPHTVLVEDNHITGQLTFATSSADTIDAAANRNEVVGPVIFAVGTFANSKLTMKNNLIVSPLGGTTESGIDVRALSGDFASQTTFTLTNNTVVGFNRGLTTENLQTGGTFNAQIQNMLLYNTDDIDGFTAAQIGNSLISDGTFTGLNGNFGGSPILTADYYLKYNSIGIDAGSNTAAASLATDLRGNPRIQDANGDGIARVDVGALETAAVPEPSALMAVMIAIPMISAGRRLFRPPHRRGNTSN